MTTLKSILAKKPLIMGVLNVTPDSFSDGGEFLNIDKAVERALQMVREGADIIDIGGESTGPGSKAVPVDEEIKRVIPVFEKLRDETKALLSVDTYKHQVALHALNIGADMVNDVTALRGDPDMADSLSHYEVPVVMMYSKDPTARTTKKEVHYDDVLQTVKDFLEERVEFAVDSGIGRKRIIVDPGMGAFVSSDPKYSLQILNQLKELTSLNLPILLGPSRKSFIGEVLDVSVRERLEGSLAASAVAIMNGASIIRTHDVQETRRVIDTVHAIQSS